MSFCTNNRQIVVILQEETGHGDTVLNHISFYFTFFKFRCNMARNFSKINHNKNPKACSLFIYQPSCLKTFCFSTQLRLSFLTASVSSSKQFFHIISYLSSPLANIFSACLFTQICCLNLDLSTLL